MMAVTAAAPAMDGAGRGWRSPNLLSPGAALAAWSALGMPLLLQARMTLGLVDALKWSVGPLMAIHILTLAPRDAAALRRAAATALLVAAPLMAVYGTLQFINPLPWDAEWLVNIRQMGVDSFGL